MKSINFKMIPTAVLALCLASCAEMEMSEYDVEKPLSIENQEEIDGLQNLKTYVSNPNFKLGAGVSMSSYNNLGAMYMLANTNFQEVTAGYSMKHGAVVQNDGSLKLDAVSKFVENTTKNEVSIYGHTLAWHANQNATFLNSTIAPTIIPASSAPTWESVLDLDFETDDVSGYESNGASAVLSFTANGEGAEATGRALKVTNPAVQTDDWRSQLFVTFSEVTEVGQVYKLEMDVRADTNASMATQAQTSPGGYKHWNFFGSIAAETEWKHISVEVTIADNTSGCNTIAFNLGNTATSYYFDNVEVFKFNESGGGPDWEDLLDQPFETEATTGYQSNGANAVLGFTADGGGANNTGRALTVTNPTVQTNDWQSQLFVTFPKTTAVGEKYKLEMDVKADTNASMATQAQTSPGGYKHWNFFGSIAAETEWKHIAIEVIIADNTSGCNTIAFNLGNTATTYYFDNVVVSWFNEDAGQDIIIERTPEEKRDTLTYHLNKWISGIMEVSKSNTHAWDVVNEPMDDGNPYELKTGIGRAEIAGDEFFWQDYLGKDYAVQAFKMAETYGNPDDILFINDYNLEYNLDKCKGIIEYVKYIEEQGARVDGIGTQMHINLDSNKENITEMFKLLAATGKMIKISELDIGVGAQTKDATEELYLAQEEMYKFVLEQYFTLIPKNQQYGITIWSPTDSPANSSWRAGEPIGLWTEKLTRKPAYRGVAEGLRGNDLN